MRSGPRSGPRAAFLFGASRYHLPSPALTTTPANPSAPSRRPPPARPTAKRRFPLFRSAFGLLLLAIGLLFEPHCFRFAFAHVLRLEAWRCGIDAQMRAVEGSLFEPVTVRDSVWIYESAQGTISRLEIKTARAEFSWRDLFSRGSAAWFRQLTIEDASGKIQIPLEAPAASEPRDRFRLPRPQGRWLPPAERIEARGVDFMFQSDGDYVRLEGASFTVSEVEPGRIEVKRLAIKQPWLNRTFHGVQGTTKLDESKAEIAAVTLEPGVEIQNLAAELAHLARGRLDLVLRLNAFGGGIVIETQTVPRDQQLTFEAQGDFSNIALGQLATFLGLPNAAGGTIKQGQFKFRGSPQNPAKATASLRLEATNFQWDSRQWDSLVLGATLLEGRVQIPELTLHQGHNHLRLLNGEFALPAAAQQWWQSEFAFNVTAKLDNLTELSALLLPEFKFAAGKATIDGAVRGRNQQFDGQLIVAGSDLTWRNAPIDDLHATLKLNGNELQLANLAIFNDGDYVRGRGVVNILGDKQYWGELRASIDDLGRYAAILQKPIVPEPMAGGAIINWSGEGSAKGHTGKFFARLRKLRSLGASAARLHPINAELEGTYAPGSMLFSQFALADDESSFTANVAVGNKALTLQGIRFLRGKTLELEGDALLPLDVWKTWPNTSLETLLDDTTVGRLTLTAHGLDLHAFAQLSGFVFPLEGLVRGKISAEGPLGAIKSSGQFALSKATIPLGWTGLLLSGVEGAATLDGQTLTLAKFGGRHPAGDFNVTGTIDFTRLRDPALQLSATSERTELTFFRGLTPPGDDLDNGNTTALHAGPGIDGAKLTTALALQISGPASTAQVTGAAQMQTLAIDLLPDLAPVLLETAALTPPAVFTLPSQPWKHWQFEVTARIPEPLPLSTQPGTVRVDLKLVGAGAQPQLIGSVQFAGVQARTGSTAVTVEEGTVEFRGGGEVSLTVKTIGTVLGQPFALHAGGPGSHLVRFIVCAPPLTPDLVRTQLTAPLDEGAARFSLLAPVALASGAEIYEWPAIADPPALSSPAEAAEPVTASAPQAR